MGSFAIPWFLFDVDNFQLITSPVCIPSDIRDTKEIFLVETPIPGLNFRPITYGGGGNRHISFTLPLIQRNSNVGNLYVLKQFDTLRNQTTGLLRFTGGQFTPTPKVLFNYGTGSVPLIYWVKRCDPTNKAGWINPFGFPQYSEIEFELWLDETSPLYFMEEIFRKINSGLGSGITSLFTAGVKPI